MGNLFRCPINSEKRWYIMKEGGSLQNGYSSYLFQYYDQTHGTVSYSNNWVKVTYSGKASVNINFDATGWNKLHIKKASCTYYDDRSSCYVGVATTNASNTSIVAFTVSKVSLSKTRTDYIIDISKISGTHIFYLYVETSASFDQAWSETWVEGDVYLTK